MSAAAVAAAPEPEQGEDVPKEERDVVIADLKTDGKTVDYTTSFTMTWKNPETGVIKAGTFSAKRATLGDLGRIAVLKAKFNGGEKVDAQTDFTHEMLAGLQVILTDFPEWWTPSDFFDPRPLREVWEYVRRWHDTFRNRRVV